ncbi:MAG: hypothetical protein E7044_00345 [Lentisphaerae bacterium]|nr:hypothetical protein [Lentisphaerota bacterium]
MKIRDGKTRSYLPEIGAFAAFLFFAHPYLLREFWFDEALTLMNFAWMPDPVRIYFSYVIPNNQIFYTIALHYWAQLPVDFFRADFFLRLLSLLFATGTLLVLYVSFRRTCGRYPLLLALSALALSPPFLIYATALRGYMASAFFTALAVKFAVDFQRKADFFTWGKYAVSCLLAVGTIPSNLLALGGCVLYALPLAGKSFWSKKRFWLLCLTPFAALAVFYLPILKSFLGVCRLGEGWQDGKAVLLAWSVTAGCVFGVLWIVWFAALIRRCNYSVVIRMGILLLPASAVILLPTAPFPRVFFPLLPLLGLIVANGIRCCSAFRQERKQMARILFGILGCVVLLSAFVLKQESTKEFLSGYCGNRSGDDFFYGFYMRKDHVPQQTAQELEKIYGRNSVLPPVYFSFLADPWPSMYYILANGQRSEFLFDGPRGKVAALAAGSLVVIHKKENPGTVAERFGVTLLPLFQTPLHSVFKVQ